MTQVLMVSSRWPHGSMTEFMEAEIPYLLDKFDSVRVAPTRPRGPITWTIPTGVEIDYSLAAALVSKTSRLGERDRWVKAAKGFVRTNPAGLGVALGDIRRDGTRAAWWRRAVLGRAEANTVRLWAAQQSPPDIAYTYWLGQVTLAMRQAWPTVPIASRVHGGDLYPYAHGLSSIPFQRAQVLACDLIACVSTHGLRFLREVFPEASGRLEVHRLGIPDPGRVAPLGGFPDELRVLSVSSLKPNKRVRLIASAVVQLARNGVRTHWTHLGHGTEMPTVSAILSAAPDALTWDLPGLVDVSEVRHRLATGSFDAFVNVSLSEGAPVSVMEAQSVGIPTVATDVGGTSEVAEKSQNVIVARDLGVGELCTAIIAAAKLPPELRGARRDRWTQKFNADTNYEAFARTLAALAY